jgi:hypothetical protein
MVDPIESCAMRLNDRANRSLLEAHRDAACAVRGDLWAVAAIATSGRVKLRESRKLTISPATAAAAMPASVARRRLDFCAAI